MNNLIHYINDRTVKLNNEETFNNVDVFVTQSIYYSGSYINTGSNYRIIIQSGSNLLASLPYENTNISVNYSDNIYFVNNNNIIINYNTFITGSDSNTSYYFNISSGSQDVFRGGIDVIQNNGNVFINSGSQYVITSYSGDSNLAGLTIYDSSSNLLCNLSQSFSSSYTLNPTSSTYYSITSSIIYYYSPL